MAGTSCATTLFRYKATEWHQKGAVSHSSQVGGQQQVMNSMRGTQSSMTETSAASHSPSGLERSLGE